MFKSSRGALIFAGLVVLGTIALVGVEEEPGTVIETSDDISRQKAELDAMIERENSLADGPAADEDDALDGWFDDDVEFMDDEELIDDAEGFDPAPMLDPSSPGVDRSGDDAIVYGDG